MKNNIESQVLLKVKKYKKGTIFFTEDFLNFGNAKAISKALERLNDKKELLRIATGMYVYPQVDTILGTLIPTTEQIAKAIAKRDKAQIVPVGGMALHSLGMSTQIPMNVVFLTNGSARKIEIGKRKIIFKKAAPKNFMTIGKISTLVIQALKEIGKEKLLLEEENQLIKHLLQEEKKKIEYDIRFAPEWIRIIFRKALNQMGNESME